MAITGSQAYNRANLGVRTKWAQSEKSHDTICEDQDFRIGIDIRWVHRGDVIRSVARSKS
jgi:hypothetical protein